jgi:hypothetical protein
MVQSSANPQFPTIVRDGTHMRHSKRRPELGQQIQFMLDTHCVCSR